MKNLSVFAFIILFGLNASAYTSITTTIVNGHWTLAGSPYKVFNDIKIDSNTCLRIDPGVEVIFQGPYLLSVIGVLLANGTVSAPISFHVQDTTNWSLHISSAGGWKGIFFDTFIGIIDSTKFRFCNVFDIKNGSFNSQYRKFNVEYSNFYHNRTTADILISFSSPDTSYSGVFDHCDIHNNIADTGTILGVTFGTILAVGGNFKMTNSTIRDNIAHTVFESSGDKVVFDNNIVSNNNEADSFSGGSSLRFVVKKLIFSKNKVYNNVSHDNASIVFLGDISSSDPVIADIYSNIICNNQSVVSMMSGGCGATQGGAGIYINTGSSTSPDFTVRNNILSNNYTSSVESGGAIFINCQNINIYNNDFVNNRSLWAGSALFLEGLSTKAKIKNNVFYNNLPPAQVSILVCDSVYFDHNWSTQFRYQDVQMSSVVLMGDTTTEILGTGPGFVSTPSPGVGVSALTANFALLPSSQCIDKGDNSVLPTLSTDYSGSNRVKNGIVDIGAYEYGAGSLGYTEVRNDLEEIISLYPNPASNLLLISTTEAKGEIQIVNATGKLIMTKNMVGMLISIDVRQFERGVYFVIWKGGSSNAVSRKLIVE